MSEIKPTEWIETVLSRIYMLEPKVGKHMVEKCGRLCAKSGDLIVKARKINAALKEENDLNKLLHAFKNELNEKVSLALADIVRNGNWRDRWFVNDLYRGRKRNCSGLDKAIW